MPRKKRKRKDDINTDSWIATYSDTITLLLTFFILLYSMSTTDLTKLQGISSALQGQLTGQGVMGGGTTNKSGENDAPLVEDIFKEDNNKTEESEKEKLKQEIEDIVESSKIGNSITIREDERGIILGLRENVFFDLGSGELKKNSLKVLKEIADILPTISNHMVVEGHTDNIPIKSSKYGSNWELSTQRAVSVVRFFVEQEGMSPTQFSATGYGEYKPLVDNSTPENRARNRRVDIVITTE